MIKLRISSTALILLTILVSACNSQPGIGNSLDGTAWILTHLGTVPLLFGSQPTLLFDSGQVSGFGSCNGFSGEYEQSGRNLIFSGITSTLMSCDQIEITQTEAAFFSALSSAVEFKIEEKLLKIYNAEGNLLLTFLPLDTSLEVKDWQMVSYFNGQSGIVSILEGSHVTAQFMDGIVSGSAGCNHYSASYRTEEGRLSIESVAVTEMYCETPAGVMDQETRFMAALTQADSYRVEGTRLIILDQAGSLILEFILP